MDTAAVDDRIAVLETSELPGNASRRDCAFVFGSSTEVLDAGRDVLREVKAGRVVRRGTVGRRRVAPKALLTIRDAMVD